MKWILFVALLASAAAITPSQTQKGGAYLTTIEQQKLENGQHAGVMPLAGSTRCIIFLLIAYFFCYSGIYFTKIYLQQVGETNSPFLEILERGCKAVEIAPMLSVLFLATRLRAVYLKGTIGASFMQMSDIPTEFTQTSMLVAASCVVTQVGLTVVVPFVTGEFVFGAKSLSGVDEGRKGLAGIINSIRTLITLTMIVFTAIVVHETINMKAPGGRDVPVSPAVQCTMMLTCAYFLAYVINDGCRTVGTFIAGENDDGSARETFLTRFEQIFKVAQQTMNMAPMVALLFIAVRMRALAMGHNNPQRWAQDCMFATTVAMIASAAMTVVAPLTFSGPAKQGIVDGDVTFDTENAIVGFVFTLIRYTILASMLVGLTAVVVSTFIIEAPAGKDTPPLSTAVACTLVLTDIYFVSLLGVWIGASVKQFMGESEMINTAIMMFDSARSTTGFIPMTTILFLATRLRAIQVAGRLKAPQNWAQIMMWVGTMGVTISSLMAFFQPLTGSGDESTACGTINNVLRSLCVLALHASVVAIIVSLFLITPQNAGDLGLKDPASWSSDVTGLGF